MKSAQKLPAVNDLFRERRHLLAGRGATVLWAALEAIAARDGERGEVILPDILCTSVLEAVLAAGFTPRFAEVDPEKYSLTAETIQPHMSKQTKAIIVVHLFGHVAPVEVISDLLAGTGIRLIEDAVQAIGGTLLSGQPVGSRGDFSFVSFDSTKIIRGRGAVLFYDDEVWTDYLLSALDEIEEASDSPSDSLLNVSWRDLYHGLGQALRQGKMPAEEAARVFRAALPIYRPLLFRAFDAGDENLGVILRDWDTLPERIEQRNALAVALQKAFTDFPILCPSVQSGDAIWRYSVRFPSREAADRFVVALREQGGLVSHLYYPLHQLYQPDQQLSTPGLSTCLVNLWVDETVDELYVQLVRSIAQTTLNH